MKVYRNWEEWDQALDVDRAAIDPLKWTSTTNSSNDH